MALSSNIEILSEFDVNNLISIDQCVFIKPKKSTSNVWIYFSLVQKKVVK